MKILVIGAAGMLGDRLVRKLAERGTMMGEKITSLQRFDAVLAAAPPQSDFPIDTHLGDLADPVMAQRLVAMKADVIFHLAAIVSGEAESNFEKGYSINLDGTRNLLDEIRQHGKDYCPKFIFTSSIAVFGAPFPDVIEDDFFSTPLTSYGTQKAISELLLADYSRRGMIDGMGLRMPTICVRPGKANLAASGFFSNIIREPLNGKPAILPVADTVRHWFASPRAAVELLLHAAELDTKNLGPRRNLSMPGLSCTVAEQIEALRRVAGEKAVQLIRSVPDPVIDKIVGGWPHNFNPVRALALGFRAEDSFDDIIKVHIEDELGQKSDATLQ
jgi:D-erythronate 2-dehydrogenase